LFVYIIHDLKGISYKVKKRPVKQPLRRALLNAEKLISSHSCGLLFFQMNTLVISFPPFKFLVVSEFERCHGYFAMYASQRIPAS
ncbi:hypothetical protein LI010_21550, partial [Enterocloster aldenensis]|uniref:hypothetical protein n=1 Tax=Enterocloster aldenensis TaxID=358742 RepID=UPI001D099E71|nr:hypothetical protein [Enterocloster aldenensis]